MPIKYPEFTPEVDEIIRRNYFSNDSIQFIYELLMGKFSIAIIERRRKQLGIKQSRAYSEFTEKQIKISRIQHLLNQKYADLDKLDILSPAYADKLNEIDNLEITAKNLCQR